MPDPGIIPHKRKCGKKQICATYGYCAKDCPEYEKSNTKKSPPVEFGEVIPPKLNKNPKTPPNPTPVFSAFEAELSKIATPVLATNPDTLQIPIPVQHISTTISWFGKRGFQYVTHVVVSPPNVILIFQR